MSLNLICNCDRCRYLRGEPFPDEERIKWVNETQKIFDGITEIIAKKPKASDIIKRTVDKIEYRNGEKG